ncbi:MAG: hypothetical protein LIP16_14360 [Clostridium sp.]|nr:hypothetical protein [Clostridium sp.]
MTKEDKKNAYLYCKFRDEQFALYDEYAKRNGMLMKTCWQSIPSFMQRAE